MSLWLEILIALALPFVVFGAVRLGDIATGIFAVRDAISSLEKTIRERDKTEPSKPEPNNEWIEHSPNPAQCEICGRSDGGHSVACTHSVRG
jgi:Sec-independent protein translocase protein TatA